MYWSTQCMLTLFWMDLIWKNFMLKDRNLTLAPSSERLFKLLTTAFSVKSVKQQHTFFF